MKHSNYEKEIRNTVQYLKLYYVSSLSGNTRCIISLATSSLSTKIYQSLAKSSEKLNQKTPIADTLIRLQEFGNHTPPESHVHRIRSVIMLSVLIRTSQVLQALGKNIIHLSDFSFDCLTAFSNTTRLKCSLEIFIPDFLTPYFCSQITNHCHPLYF